VGQGSALSPILSAIYLALIIKTFKKRIKNLKENIPTDILSFVDNVSRTERQSIEVGLMLLAGMNWNSHALGTKN